MLFVLFPLVAVTGGLFELLVTESSFLHPESVAPAISRILTNKNTFFIHNCFSCKKIKHSFLESDEADFQKYWKKGAGKGSEEFFALIKLIKFPDSKIYFSFYTHYSLLTDHLPTGQTGCLLLTAFCLLLLS